MKYSGIGGQAVIEGIMMMNRNDYAVAVRKPDQEIEVKRDRYISITQKVKLFSLPFIRGVFRFADSMIVGMKTLTYSASFFEDDEDSEPGKIEQFLNRVLGEKLESALMALVMVLSFVMAIGIFMLLPLFIAGLFSSVIESERLMAVLEGIIRILIFIAYIKLVSRMEDIRRTFMYHGAEHKCINCVEHGLPLTVENVRNSSKEHKRCGTSFILIVMVISILFFMVVRVDNVWMRFASRIVLVPVIAGVSYEILQLAGRSNSRFMDLVSRPGMWMQGLTTKEPDDSMIEVAIAATEAVFDWKAYLRENFPDTDLSAFEDSEDSQEKEEALRRDA
ncbi:MAG: DUF1385 domain-containing protein [Clostridium sp.]|nr:DUF1385 domain-containing protein [Clostridium sp.]